LDGIRSGAISLAFRSWKRPSAKKGSLIHTAIGRVEILEVLPVQIESISTRDAQRAGFSTKKELSEHLAQQKEGFFYKIQIKYHSPDPRINLRSQHSLNDEELMILKNRLSRMDQKVKHNVRSHQLLEIIKKYPGRRAGDLAEILKVDKDWLKIYIRKLKNLGLTISHEVGYSLSPLGVFVLNQMND
jgi:hypothetical protein